MDRLRVAAALREAAALLAPVTDAARLEAEWLMAHALGCSRSELLLRHMADPAPATFDALVARRARGEPLAHVTGETEFYGLTLRVTPDVLVPRSDTELLIDIAREKLARRPPRRILDCGTGSGALLLAALSVWPRAEGIGIERSPAALAVARANMVAQKVSDRATMMAADWTRSGWTDDLGRFDLVLANPPYVATDDSDLARDVAASDPHGALFAGASGLDDYRLLVPALHDLLAPGGWAVFEIGSRQGGAVSGIGEAAGLRADVHQDLAHRPRAVSMWHESGDAG